MNTLYAQSILISPMIDSQHAANPEYKFELQILNTSSNVKSCIQVLFFFLCLIYPQVLAYD